jgi:aldose 1-epimerase
MRQTLFFLFMTAHLAACNNNPASQEAGNSPLVTVTSEKWGQSDGKDVFLYTLKNTQGVEVKLTSYGARITSLLMPDKNGKAENIVLGFESLTEYENPNVPYFGAVVGRYGNRIAGGKFTIGNQTYTLARNNGENHLHGGLKGFDKVVWDGSTEEDSSGATVNLSYLSVDGEEGYPGNLQVTVTYTLTSSNELQVRYHATTDKATPVNLTQHSYFNLTGDHRTGILDHSLVLYADRYTPVDKGLIPTGELRAVAGTPFDFTSPHKIGERIGQTGGGYDHNFVLNTSSDSLSLAAVLSDSSSGRKLEVYTTEPGMQFYTGNFLDGTLSSGGRPFNQYAGLCLETQHFPDSPNQPAFPSTILQPGSVYNTVTVFKLITE